MATTTNSKTGQGHLAVAKALNLPVSTKHCIEICDSLRYRDVSYAKKFLEEVMDLKRAVPFRKYVMNTGHKKGMSTGRFPTKAASEVLKLLKSVEANAQFKGLNTGSLKITKLVVNKASIPFTGARHRTATKRTHLEVEVKERGVAGKKKVESVAEKKEPKETVAVKHDHAATMQHDHNHEGHEHGHDHKHDHASHDHNHEHASTPAKPAVKVKAAAEEPSSAELLKRAQQKAAELKRQEKERKDTQQVENLYEELQKKGSLRSAGVRK